jgi:acyl transferase domain-containing protein
MSNKNVFCFSGQGSNYYNMSKELYTQNGTFKKWMDQFDEMAKPLIHESILSILFDENKKMTCT